MNWENEKLGRDGGGNDRCLLIVLFCSIIIITLVLNYFRIKD